MKVVPQFIVSMGSCERSFRPSPHGLVPVFLMVILVPNTRPATRFVGTSVFTCMASQPADGATAAFTVTQSARNKIPPVCARTLKDRMETTTHTASHLFRKRD